MTDTDQTPPDQTPPNEPPADQPPPHDTPKWKSYRVSDSRVTQVTLIALVIVILQIPMFWVEDLIRERAHRQRQAETDIGKSWGGRQTVIGPILVITKDPDRINRKPEEIKRNTHFLLPLDLTVDTTLDPESRRRGIFQSVVHATSTTLQGQFMLPEALRNDPLVEAHLLLMVGDARGLTVKSPLKWNGVESTLSPSEITPFSRWNLDHLRTEPVSLAAGHNGDPLKFSVTLGLRGHGAFQVVPVGNRTKVTMAGDWPSPSFVGNQLPDRHDITETAFSAEWTVGPFGRTLPAQWTAADDEVTRSKRVFASAFGVKPVLMVDDYQQVKRAAKYGNLILFTTFLFYFLLDVVGKRRVHPVQYAILGLSLSLFHVLLLSITEIAGFGPAYALSSAAILAQAGLYGRSLAGTAMALAAGLLMGSLYGVLYLILGMESYALLGGAIVLFIGLSLLMFLTRRVNWWGPASQPA